MESEQYHLDMTLGATTIAECVVTIIATPVWQTGSDSLRAEANDNGMEIS